MFSFTRFCLRVLADLNEIIRRMKRNIILTIAIRWFKRCEIICQKKAGSSVPCQC
jgi:hypothetical protein